MPDYGVEKSSIFVRDFGVKEEPRKRQAGITLIALVITIIILLILAGVSISMLTGQNGILTKANEAKTEMEENTVKEKLQVAITGSYDENSFNYKELKNNLLNIEGLNLLLGQEGGNLIENLEAEIKGEDFPIKIRIDEYEYSILDKGIVNNVYKISTAEDLKNFRDEVNTGNTFKGETIYLENNINLDINEEWVPIGYYPMENSGVTNINNKPFSGVFDGDGHEVNGININTEDKVQGLFGLVVDGTIMNLGIGENCRIKGGISTGGLVGYLYNGAIVNKCYNNSRVEGSSSLVGGISGQTINSIIKNSYNSGEIVGKNSDVGGITGAVVTNKNAIRICE